jgi:hypothetical protein
MNLAISSSSRCFARLNPTTGVSLFAENTRAVSPTFLQFSVTFEVVQLRRPIGYLMGNAVLGAFLRNVGIFVAISELQRYEMPNRYPTPVQLGPGITPWRSADLHSLCERLSTEAHRSAADFDARLSCNSRHTAIRRRRIHSRNSEVKSDVPQRDAFQ